MTGGGGLVVAAPVTIAALNAVRAAMRVVISRLPIVCLYVFPMSELLTNDDDDISNISFCYRILLTTSLSLQHLYVTQIKY